MQIIYAIATLIALGLFAWWIASPDKSEKEDKMLDDSFLDQKGKK